MEIKPKLYKLIKRFITQSTKGSDVFMHNGSRWIIFVEDKKWVIELTKEGTLWYNYYFFQNIFELVDLDVVENQHYITKWVEDTIINGVKSVKGEYYKEIQKVEYTIQNGVKHTSGARNYGPYRVEETIQNGVKHTSWDPTGKKSLVEDTIQNGVIHTIDTTHHKNKLVEDTIQNGVKSTVLHIGRKYGPVEDTIQNGVKETHSGCDLLINDKVEDTIQNGVKETELHKGNRPLAINDAIQNGVKYTGDRQGNYNLVVEDTIQNGVKKTYSDKIPHEYDWSDQFTEEIDDIIQNGVKHTEKSLQIDGSCVIEDVIKEGVKHTEYGDWLDGDERLDDIIENGIKETTPGGYLGSVEMKGKTVHQFEHSKQDNDVEDVIESGIKATTTNYWLSEDKNQITEIEDVISNGIKKTEGGILFDESKIDTVISEGIKETIPVVPGDILDTIDFMSYNNTTNVQHLISDVIEKGIKETHDDVMPHTGRVEGVIKNGVKECIPSRTPLYNPMDFSVQYRENHRLDVVEIVLEKGIKEVQPLPAQDGNMDYSNYYYRQGESCKPHTKYVDDAIRDGVKETWGYEKQPQNRINEVIENGTKENPS